mmetsp:Transcript_18719/g.38730  ORF Transcript_18719/g.38730 Transcript_18719/m.38730 type:complete len:514 (-) Transcript_18719:97-1638(-)
MLICLTYNQKQCANKQLFLIVLLFVSAIQLAAPFRSSWGVRTKSLGFSWKGIGDHVNDGISPQARDAATLFALTDKGKAFPEQTPHSGRHFSPSHPAYRFQLLRRLQRRSRFMEGWYYRLTIPEQNASFAFIISIEDAGKPKSKLRLACIQVVGPDDTYLVQADPDDTKFWGMKSKQALGYTFEYNNPNGTLNENELRQATALERHDWLEQVKSGFQILPTSLLGRVNGHDGTLGGVLDGQGIPGHCEFDFTVDPVCGWGSAKSTGGWLSHFSVFEPHWQVTMADGNATGRVTWHNKTYDFSNAKFYAEKNWGAALPSKWYWTQCNSFDGYQQLSVTAGGGVRGIPFGGKESLGMVCVHYNNVFYEATPWTGEMQWNVTTWGSWELSGKSIYGDRPFEAKVSYQVDPEESPGLVFRAPTPDEGMVYFCRDTFDAHTKLTLWELDKTPRGFVRKPGPPLIDGATSRQGGAEVGGGPWWDTWTATSKVSKPILALLRFPVRIQSFTQRRLFRGRR